MDGTGPWEEEEDVGHSLLSGIRESIPSFVRSFVCSFSGVPFLSRSGKLVRLLKESQSVGRRRRCRLGGATLECMHI